MYRLGHVGFALAFYAPLGAWMTAQGDVRLGLSCALVAAGVSTLPDVDEYLDISHRGPTHTIWFVAGVGFVSVVVGALVGAVFGRTLIVAALLGSSGTLAIASHLAADALTPMGVRPFAPLWDRHLSLNLTPANNPRANAVLFAAGIGSTVLGQAIFVL